MSTVSREQSKELASSLIFDALDSASNHNWASSRIFTAVKRIASHPAPGPIACTCVIAVVSADRSAIFRPLPRGGSFERGEPRVELANHIDKSLEDLLEATFRFVGDDRRSEPPAFGNSSANICRLCSAQLSERWAFPNRRPPSDTVIGV
jgi:hypothetical protein